MPGHADGPVVVRTTGRALLLIAGIPGAGKSVLLRTLATAPGVRVLDSDTVRAALARRLPRSAPYASYRWLVHLLHRASVVRACLGRDPAVVIHLPATRPRVRAAVRGLARISRRAAHLVWVDVAPELALDGQLARGRRVRPRAFAGHVAHAEASLAALRGDREPGWASVAVVGREAGDAGLVLDRRGMSGSW